MRANYIVVVDCETGGLDAHSVEITQLAAVAINPANLEIMEDRFCVELSVLDESLLTEGALRVTKKTRESIRQGVHPAEGWASFCRWANQWRVGGKADSYSAPIAAGHNYCYYDGILMDRYCLKYGPYRFDKRAGMNVSSLFYKGVVYDTLHMLAAWSENQKGFDKLGLEALRRYFKMPKNTIAFSHDALQDVVDTAEILVRLLRLHRKTAPNVIWEGCFDEAYVAAEKARRKELRGRRQERETRRRRSAASAN